MFSVSIIDDRFTRVMSLINSRNNKGLRLDPCGTPDVCIVTIVYLLRLDLSL